MTKVYKLTDQKHQTRNNTQWGPGVEHSTSGEGDLCGPGWLHAYTHPLLAAFLNPTHANIKDPVLWEAEADGEMKSDHGTKVGYTCLKTIKIIPLPEVTVEQRVKFGILSAKKAYIETSWNLWADKWLSGEDRSYAATATARAAAHAADAAYAAADAAAHAADAAYAAAHAAHAAYAAADAAYAAADAAHAAASPIDLISIAEEAIK